MKESLVRIDNLSLNIGLKTILKNMTIALYREESVLLTGENGSGKSTFLKSIFGSQNKKEFHWTISKKRELVSYLGHELGLYSSLTLEENLDYFSKIIKNPISKVKIKSHTERFGLGKRLKDPIYTFSEGMKRKAGIIRALLVNAELLLMDEPFNGLDSNSLEIFYDILYEIKNSTSILIVSHDNQKIKSFVNRHIHLKNGYIEEIND